MVKIKVNEQLLNEIKSYYAPFIKDNNGEYVYFYALFGELQIIGYNNNKELKTVTFSGPNEKQEANRWSEPLECKKKKIHKSEWLDLHNQIGSDEVGNGDFLAPIIVVAAYIKDEDITLLRQLGVDDSKKISDNNIKIIAPKLIDNIQYAKVTLSNAKYNELIAKGENINSIKAIMHNHVLAKLKQLHPRINHVFIDQFCPIDKYYQYLDTIKDKEIILNDIIFHTKGESFYPSVAVSSIIARYYLLQEINKLNQQYNMLFPLGAGAKVDAFAKQFIAKYGIDELTKLCKKDFKNYSRLLQNETK